MQYLERQIAEFQQTLLNNRFQFLCFELVKPEDIDRIAHELEPLVSLYAQGIDPGACAELHLIRESAACPLLIRLLDGTPLLQLVESDGSIKVQIPGALLVALENYVQHCEPALPLELLVSGPLFVSGRIGEGLTRMIKKP
ncbi:hypothetical protein D9M70_589710 [compost metagenome]